MSVSPLIPSPSRPTSAMPAGFPSPFSPPAPGPAAPLLLLLQTLSGPLVRYDRLVSIALIRLEDGSCVDAIEPPRGDQVYIAAFFDYLSYGLPLAQCTDHRAQHSTHLFLRAINDAQHASSKDPGMPLVLAAIAGTEPVRWTLGSHIPLTAPTPPAAP